jgi:hypothetical protein
MARLARLLNVDESGRLQVDSRPTGSSQRSAAAVAAVAAAAAASVCRHGWADGDDGRRPSFLLAIERVMEKTSQIGSLAQGLDDSVGRHPAKALQQALGRLRSLRALRAPAWAERADSSRRPLHLDSSTRPTRRTTHRNRS